MNDTNPPSRSRRLSWPVKLILTVIVGGAFSCGTFWHFSSTYNDPLRSAFALHIITIFFWADLIATSLYLFERDGWRKAITRGLVLALAASVIIVLSLVVLFFAVVLLVDNFIH